MNKRIMLSGGRPTGHLHLGHFVGALQTFVELQKKYECWWIVSDFHMMTTKHSHGDIRAIDRNARDMVIDCIGAGFDMENTNFYLQSNIPEMPQIFVIIQNLVNVSRAQNTPSLREMADNAILSEFNMGLLSYPVLEAADIISLQANVVPVGRDNIDHIVITQEIVSKLNKLYGTSFVLPEWETGKENYLVGVDGLAKMSKSLNNAIYLRDTPQQVSEKVQQIIWRGQTNTENQPNNEPIIIYHKAFNPDSRRISTIEEMYKNGSIKERDVKDELISILQILLQPMRDTINMLINDREKVDYILRTGTERAHERSSATLRELKQVMGLPQLI